MPLPPLSLLFYFVSHLQVTAATYPSISLGPHTHTHHQKPISVAWSKPLNVGQNSLAPAQVLKVNSFDSWGTSTRRFCS